jgi:hypothetical protein
MSALLDRLLPPAKLREAQTADRVLAARPLPAKRLDDVRVQVQCLALGGEVEVAGSYEVAQAPGRDDPGNVACFELHAVYIGHREVTEGLNEPTLDELEALGRAACKKLGSANLEYDEVQP